MSGHWRVWAHGQQWRLRRLRGRESTSHGNAVLQGLHHVLEQLRHSAQEERQAAHGRSRPTPAASRSNFRMEGPRGVRGHTGTQRGFIAQDVEKVLPEWVRGDSEGFKILNLPGLEPMIMCSFRTRQN